MILPDSIKKKLTGSQSAFVCDLFKNCPDRFAASLTLRSYRPGQTLLRTDDPCTYVYLLLEGNVQATEERVTMDRYHFTVLPAMDIMGDYELFTQTGARLVTLCAITPCLCLLMPSGEYLSWIRKDANALFLRMTLLIRQITSQTVSERQTFFQTTRERFEDYLARECVMQEDATCLLPHTRQEVSTSIGCSVRTLNRLISRLKEEGLVQTRHGKIVLSSEQYRRVRQKQLP